MGNAINAARTGYEKRKDTHQQPTSQADRQIAEKEDKEQNLNSILQLEGIFVHRAWVGVQFRVRKGAASENRLNGRIKTLTRSIVTPRQEHYITVTRVTGTWYLV